MSRSVMIAAATFATLLANPMTTASAQNRDDGIVVRGPHASIRDEQGSIMKMSRLTGSTDVYYGDLDLRTSLGREELRNRVIRAASHTCARLDKLNASNIPLTRDDPCMREAVYHAQEQVDDAIATYGG